jgi:ABC-2 type transport system permease protein
MNTEGSLEKTRVRQTSPTWWLIFMRELTDLWIGGKAFNLILIYSIMLGIMVYVFSFNSELSLIPPKEATYEMLKNAMAVSLFIALVIGADMLSGERERATLESLLLTPANRRQIIFGKFLAGSSPWPVAFLIAIPFMKVLSQGDEVLVPAIIWGAITGTFLVVGYTGLGMLVSFWSSSNKVSYFVSLGIYVLFLVPSQLPGKTQAGAVGQFLQWVNPLAAVNHFLSKHLVNYEPLSLFWNWLISPAVFFSLIVGLLFLYAAPKLRLEPGRPNKLWAFLGRKMGISILVVLLLGMSVFPARALETDPTDLQITIDLSSSVVKTGDKVEYNTVVTNKSAQASPSLIVAMNVINLDAKGEVVDPEDWSPQRTQYIESLPAGQSATQHWIINTILDGNYMVYMVLIPRPDAQNATSQPIATSGIHLIVTPFTRLNPGGVLPYAIGIPLLVVIGILVIYRLRRRNIDETGGTA